jgi:hypothetical protein
MRRHRLRLEGEEMETPDGTKLVSINGISWFEPSPNGRYKEKNPPEEITVYQAPIQPGDNGNGRESIEISGKIKIPASVS